MQRRRGPGLLFLGSQVMLLHPILPDGSLDDCLDSLLELLFDGRPEVTLAELKLNEISQKEHKVRDELAKRSRGDDEPNEGEERRADGLRWRVVVRFGCDIAGLFGRRRLCRSCQGRIESIVTWESARSPENPTHRARLVSMRTTALAMRRPAQYQSVGLDSSLPVGLDAQVRLALSPT